MFIMKDFNQRNVNFYRANILFIIISLKISCFLFALKRKSFWTREINISLLRFLNFITNARQITFKQNKNTNLPSSYFVNCIITPNVFYWGF